MIRRAFLLSSALVLACAKEKPAPVAGPILCAGHEVDLAHDPNNCGFCAHRCEASEGTTSCVDGACSPVCKPGYLACIAAEGCAHEAASDPTACGSCDVTCHGAPCVNGACAPPAPSFATFAEDVGGTLALRVVDATHVWVKDGMRVRLSDGVSETIEATSFQPRAADGALVYGWLYSNGTPSLARRDAAGKVAVVVPADDTPFFSELAVDAGRAVFWRRQPLVAGAPTLYRIVALDLETKSEHAVVSDQPGTGRLVVREGRVFWFLKDGPDRRLFSAPLAGGAPTTLTATGGPPLGATSTDLIFGDAAGIARVPLGGGVAKPLLIPAEDSSRVTSVAFGGGAIWWTIKGPGKAGPVDLYRWKL